MTSAKIPICLIVGFLGSGKTTLLRHILKTNADKQLAFVVNEFSALDIDGAIIKREHDKVVCLAGGSVFCRCLSGQFTKTLKDLPAILGMPRCDGVVVEASGIADPGSTRQMLFETGLDLLYALSRIVAVVDPGNIRALLDQLPNSRMQLLAADIILLNKQDVYTRSEMEEAEAIVRSVNEHASIMQTAHCQTAMELFEGVSAVRLSGAPAHSADPNFAHANAHPNAAVDVDKFLRALNASQDILYRAKGFLPCVGGAVYLDWTPSTMSRFDLPDYAGTFGFVFIGVGARAGSINALAARLESGAFSTRANA